MDVHRCRFVPFPPSTINALAFSHSYISKDQKTAPPRLAVGRANGDIEIWNPQKGQWLQETIIHGGKDRSIDGLVWTQDPNEEVHGKTIIGKSRLFSIGYTTTVTEWDLEKGRPLRQVSGNHGEIWCLAAQPQLPSNSAETNGATLSQWSGQNLITGCTDGALVLYSTKDDGLELQKVLVRPSAKKAKIISVTFQDRNIVVAGCSDSTIRIYDIRNGQSLRSMSLGSGPKGGPKEIIVWSVKVLKNGNIVSGDSTGELKIWDGKTYTLLQRILSHKQDLLSLATSSDGTTIFSGGMDRRTVVYKPVGKGKNRWEEVAHRRFHSHDVKTMTSFEGRGMSFVISGGPDASPTVIPLGQYGFENQRSLPFLPQEPTIRSAPRKRLMMSWWDREINIWRLNKASKSTDYEDPEDEPAARNRKLVAKILIKGEANITSAALSEGGSLLAVSTTTDIKMFRLRPTQAEEGDGLRITKIEVPVSFSSGARLLQFSPDSKWLCIIRPDSQLTLARVVSSASSPITIHPQLSKPSRLDRRIEKYITLGGLGNYNRTITQSAFSTDSRILVVSDLAGYIDTFVLSGHEDLTQAPSDAASDNASASSSSNSESDSDDEEDAKPKFIFGQHWTRNPSANTIPKLPSAPVVLSFRPASNPVQKTLTNGAVVHATRNNPRPISHELPAGEDRLLVLTATSDVFEFEVLKGGLSPWSRRNPTAAFPEEFRQVLDQVRGCIWDITSEKQRVWLYGIGWLWMFDVSRDLPPPENSLTNGAAGEPRPKKRKRNNPKSSSTGAGSTIPEQNLNTGISRKMQRIVHEELHEAYRVAPKLDDAMDLDEEEASNDDSEDISSLERLRRGGEEAEAPTADGSLEQADSSPHYFHTYKYRPILGMCVIGDREGDDSDVDPDSGLEVAIVERPIWEADLPPRYYGDQEWVKKDL